MLLEPAELEEVEPFDELDEEPFDDVLDDELSEDEDEDSDEGFAAVELFESDRESVR